MSLSSRISNVITRHTLELHLLLQFVSDINAYITKSPELPNSWHQVPANIQSEFNQHVGEFMKWMEVSLKEAKEPSSHKRKRVWHFQPTKSNPEFDEYIVEFMRALQKPISYPQFLYSMALTHSIVVFEALLRDFLLAIFTERRSTLKSNNTVTYEQILSSPSMKELTNELATSKVDKILSKNIDSTVDNLKQMFSFDVSGFGRFHILREAYYRRNIIVHKNGITDRRYCEKISNSTPGIHLTADLQYIETLFTTMGQFIDYLNNHFSSKMRYRINPLNNKLFHHDSA